MGDRENQEAQSLKDVEERGRPSAEKYDAALRAPEGAGEGFGKHQKAMEELTAATRENSAAQEEAGVFEKAAQIGILRGLRSAVRWAEAGEILDELVEAGWCISLTHGAGGWALAMARENGAETLRLGSGWHAKAAGAIFEAADLAEEALAAQKPVPEVNGHDHFGFEGEEGR